MSEKRAPSDLLNAAQAFDDELAHFARLVEAARTGPLNSQKNLQRAAQSFQQVGESEKRLGEAAQVLVGALQSAKHKQEEQALVLQGRAEEIEKRSNIASDLLLRYGAVGEKAGEINALVLEIATKKANGTPEPDDAVVTLLGQLRARMTEVAESAATLVAAAREADFDDIARQADSMRQQIVAVGGKVRDIERALAARSTTPGGSTST